jgi:hypothetical protein
MVAFLGFVVGVVAMGAAVTANSMRVIDRQDKRHKQELLRLRTLRQETEADLDVQQGRAARGHAKRSRKSGYNPAPLMKSVSDEIARRRDLDLERARREAWARSASEGWQWPDY